MTTSPEKTKIIIINKEKITRNRADKRLIEKIVALNYLNIQNSGDPITNMCATERRADIKNVNSIKVFH